MWGRQSELPPNSPVHQLASYNESPKNFVKMSKTLKHLIIKTLQVAALWYVAL